VLGRIGDLGVEPVGRIRDGHQDQPADPIGVIQRELQRHPAAEAEAEHVRPVDAEMAEQPGHVAREVTQVDVAVDVSGAAVSLQFGGDQPAPRGQVGQQVAERQVDADQAAVQQHQR
jgi:hypothetical protein